MSLKITELPVSEKNYEEEMKNKVEPYLASLREDIYFKSWDDRSIHCEQYIIPNAVGSVVIVHGFTESAEKFREMTYSFILMGYNVFALDNRGHGKSYRKNPDKFETVTVDNFDEYIFDLNFLIETKVKPAVGDSPLYIYAHSMGGAIAVQYLQKYPGVFKKAVLSAPMILANSGPLSPGLTLSVMRTMCLLGKKDEMVFIHKGFNPERTWEQSHDTSKARFEYYHQKRIQNTLLQTSGASYSWVREAMKVAKKNLDPERCKKIEIPVLLCQPEEDSSVISEKEDEFISLVQNGRLEKFYNCKHEIYASVDETLLIYLQTIEAFLKE
ncbi:MAG: alpha/beta hydrolase [Oscillospiraceae bacterium]|nr:alpha/beta hydrolase [Oscillospiraceae bacterium]